MKTYFYFLFLLSLSLAGQTKDAQKRLYYNLTDNGKQLYIMGKYQLELIPYDEAFGWCFKKYDTTLDVPIIDIKES